VGEQSAKSLRTDRMEGVIFNGTQARKATSMCEVVLTLNLMEHFNVPEGLQLNPEGFTVGRRLYRSGESEYYLDGRRCRLKDIQALFEGTGLGPNSYALIEQGRIGQILSSKPADRRSLIEEAARITLFRSRRYSAEMKLEMAQQNLLRVHDIIREVARQLNSLRRQAAKARRYSRLREEFRAAQRLRLALERRVLQARLEECSQRFDAALRQEQAILAELALLEQSRAAAQEESRQQEEAVGRVRDELDGLKQQASDAKSRRQSIEAQRSNLDSRMRDLDREQVAMDERTRVIEREQQRLRTSCSALAGGIARELEALDKEQSRSELLQTAIREAEQGIEELRGFLLTRAGQLSDLRNAQLRCQENLQRITAQVQRIEGERDSTARQREALAAEQEALQRRLDAEGNRLQETQAMLDQAEQRQVRLAADFESASAEFSGLQEQYSLLQHRLSSLEEVERRRSNYSEGVQKFLSTQLPGEDIPPPQTLADNVETDPAYESAVEDYLNEALQYILVDGIDEAVHNVERVKRIRAGKCTFMTLRNGHNHERQPERAAAAAEGVYGYLDDLLRMSEGVRDAFERVLPEYASTLMVDDLNTGFRIAENRPGTSFLTLSGEAYSSRGTLSAAGERKSMAGFLALKREKRELQSKQGKLKGRIQAARDALSRIREEQALVSDSAKSLSAEVRKLELESVVIRHQVDRVTGELDKIGQTEKVAKDELARLIEERLEQETRLKESAAAVVQIEERSRSGGEDLRERTGRLESLKSESAAVSRSLSSMASAYAVSNERKSSLEAELRRLEGEAAEVARRVQSGREERDAILERGAGLEVGQKEAEAFLESCARAVAESEAALAAAQKQLAGMRESLSGSDGKLRALHSAREEALASRGKIEIEKTRLESDLEHLQRACQEELHLSLEELAEQIPAADWQRDPAEVGRNHDELRDRIENFGPINMRALEEYQELDERYQFLDKQRSDIEQSIADTQKAIADINRRSVEQFQHAFKHIRENFMEVYQILFRGGQCDLRLLDDGDVLESGIDIIAQPPGKRLQNVLLLSGGEKALTALALLIAIFRYRPSPFCVLDEVDAPLDDANVVRFTDLLVELSKDTQFIVVTHNKKTMEVAGTLYGVTMEEPGVSKIVSVEFSRPESKAS
jgi:chromosome segregation protein